MFGHTLSLLRSLSGTLAALAGSLVVTAVIGIDPFCVAAGFRSGDSLRAHKSALSRRKAYGDSCRMAARLIDFPIITSPDLTNQALCSSICASLTEWIGSPGRGEERRWL